MNNETAYEMRIRKCLATIALADSGAVAFTQLTRQKYDGNDKHLSEGRELQIEFTGQFLFRGVLSKKTHRIVLTSKEARELLHGMNAIDSHIHLNRRFIFPGTELVQMHSRGFEYGVSIGEKLGDPNDVFIIDHSDLGYARLECPTDAHSDLEKALAHFR